MKHNLSFLVILAGVTLLSCTHSWRKPAGVNAAGELSLIELSANIYGEIQSRSFDEKNCSSTLTDISNYVERYDLQDGITGLATNEVPTVLQNFWNSRLVLHDRLNSLSGNCHAAIKRTFLNLRNAEEYIAEVAQKVRPLDPTKIDFQKEAIPMKENSSRYVNLYRTGGAAFDLREGDVMLTRGVTFLSAMISRIGDPSPYSHVVMVSKDPMDGELKTVESYVGKGVAFYDMDYALKNENGRMLVLRPRNSDVGIASSRAMAKMVRDRLNAKKPIKYDYDLDFNDRKTLSCAEVSQYAFELGSSGKMNIPAYPSVLKSNSDLILNLGVTGGTTYAPGDLEIDPRFELVGEFRDLGFTRDSRQKDAILSSMVNWMDSNQYKLRKNFAARMAVPVWLAGRTFLWPLFSKAFDIPKATKSLPVKMIRTMSMMNDIGEVLLNVAKQADADFEKRTGYPMTFQQIMEVLEKFRRDDLALYENRKTRKQSTMHKLFRPDGV